MKNLIRKILREELEWFEEPGIIEIPELKEPKLSKNKLDLILTDGAVMLLSGKDKSEIVNTGVKTLRNYSVNNVIPYKKMRFKQGGLNMYSMDVSFKKVGENQWIVIGRSGDYGWGYWFFSKKNLYGMRVRNQIFNQVIKDFNQKIMGDK
jgi:hypothetical protein